MLRFLRDSELQSIAAVLGLFIGIIAIVISMQMNLGTGISYTANIASVQVNLPFDANYDVEWSSPDGSHYMGLMSIEIKIDRTVTGEIYWILMASPYLDMQAKIGFGAVEYIRGNYEPSTGTLEVDGFERDDPYELIGLGNYTLSLRDEGDKIAGVNYVFGELDGTLNANRRD